MFSLWRAVLITPLWRVNVNFNVFFKLMKVYLLVGELYIYQNARCNDKKKNVPCTSETKYMLCLIENLAFFLKQTINSQPLKAYDRSQDSAVSKVTRLLAGQFRFVCWKVQKALLFSKMPWPALGMTQSPIQWVPGYFSGIKRPGYGVGPTPPRNAKAKTDKSYTCTPPVWHHGVVTDFTFKSIWYPLLDLYLYWHLWSVAAAVAVVAAAVAAAVACPAPGGTTMSDPQPAQNTWLFVHPTPPVCTWKKMKDALSPNTCLYHDRMQIIT